MLPLSCAKLGFQLNNNLYFPENDKLFLNSHFVDVLSQKYTLIQIYHSPIETIFPLKL